MYDCIVSDNEEILKVETENVTQNNFNVKNIKLFFNLLN